MWSAELAQPIKYNVTFHASNVFLTHDDYDLYTHADLTAAILSQSGHR